MARLIDADALYNGAMKDEYFKFKESDKTGREAFAYSCAMQRLAEAPAVNQWISVNDRLPTYAELKNDEVLVRLEDGYVFSTYFDECIEDESIFGEWHQNFDPVTLGATDSEWHPIAGVTHWMPLPEPPKEGE